MRKEFTPEYVPAQGIVHYLLHGPEHRDAPILLYLHGGPGFPEHFHALQLERAWNGLFTQVHWDQRGAGMTLACNDRTATPQSIDQITDDLHSIVEHLKRRYETPRIVILGHSWGSILGSLYALRHPENVAAYVGSGQAVSMRANEREGFMLALRQAQAAHDAKSVAALEQLGDYPPADFDALMSALPTVRKVQEKYEQGAGGLAIALSVLADGMFNLRDIPSLVRASKANRPLLRELVDFNLRAYPARYACPVHYILGQDDTTTPTALAGAYFDEIASMRKGMTIIPDAAHSPMFEQPEAFAKALEVVRAGL